MNFIAAISLMLISICAVIYSHHRLSFHLDHKLQLWIIHITLIVVGIGFAWVSNKNYAPSGALQVVIAITAFSVTHVPSACILFLKRKRREQL